MAFPRRSQRLAWLADTIPKLPGTGIIYVATTRDAELVTSWLKHRGLDVEAYYGSIRGLTSEENRKRRRALEKRLARNHLKALVATSALGMGYDKPDLGFVIHYQAPSSVVSYYQQVGRAGRAIDHAVGVLLSGREDDDIHEYFRGTAFPPERDVVAILNALDESEGMSIVELQRHLNLRQNQIEKVLKLLSVENPAPIIKLGTKWQRTPVPFEMDRDRIEHLTHQRELEWQQIQEYIETKDCLMVEKSVQRENYIIVS